MTFRETPCKTILNKSGLADYTLNCYVGCSHKCLYCYAHYMQKYKKRPEGWGNYVDIKVNAAWALTRDIRKAKQPGTVFMSSVCDGWQPIEAKYKLSRACLKLLLEAGFSPDILTKSSLVLRDLDLLAAYKTPRLSMTLTTMDLGLKRLFEPYASDPKDRILTLRKASEKSIEIGVFLGPLIPEFTDTVANLGGIFDALKGLNLTQIYVDRLNLRWGVLDALKKGLIGERDFVLDSSYSRQLKQRTMEAARQANLLKKVKFCF